MKPKIELGDELVLHHFAKEWRTYKKVSQTELARRIGTTQSEISKVERFDKRSKANDLAAIAFGLGVEIEELILVNPLKPDLPKLVYSKVMNASEEKQQEVFDVIEAMLKKAG